MENCIETKKVFLIRKIRQSNLDGKKFNTCKEINGNTLNKLSKGVSNHYQDSFCLNQNETSYISVYKLKFFILHCSHTITNRFEVKNINFHSRPFRFTGLKM